MDADPEYKTFDKMKHNFEGTYSYVLVQTKNLPSNLPEIYIEGTNVCDDNERKNELSEEDSNSQDEDDDMDTEESTRSQELKIKVYNITVELKQKHKVLVSIWGLLTPFLGGVFVFFP